MGPADVFLGTVLAGRFRLVEHKGDGNFSHVFRAEDLTPGPDTAIKLLGMSASSSPEAVIEFRDEGVLLGRLSSTTNVIDYIGTETETIRIHIGGKPLDVTVPYHVLEYGEASLSELTLHPDLVPWKIKLSLFRDVTHGIHEMHLRGIVHRDLKSSNILVMNTNTRNPVAKICDLGRSRDTTAPARFVPSQYELGRGDLSFAPPEFVWFQGDSTEQSYRRQDIYLLGSIFFELATGQGITPIAIPDVRQELLQAVAIPPNMRGTAFKAAVPRLRAGYSLALSLLRSQLPAALRHHGVALVAQLCDPDPSRREARYKAEQAIPTAGVEWIFRRLDIMSRELSLEERRRSRRVV